MYRILVVMPVNPNHKEMIIDAAKSNEVVFSSQDMMDIKAAHQFDIIIGNISPKFIAGSDRLKWVQLNSAGTDGYLSEGILPKNCILTNATGAYGLAISEHMVASLLCLMKKLDKYSENQKQSIWNDLGPVRSIYGSKTLVVGYGNIGSEFATRMHALGSTVSAIRRNKTEKPEYLESLHQMDEFYECLAQADIIAASLPGTKDTYHIFDQKAFSAMKDRAYFLNVGRGSSVDSYALADALNSGHLAGAAVDVTEPEPLPENHPLWCAKNLLITPHISGGYHLQQTHDRIVGIACDNLKRFLSGEKLTNIVDFDTGYRKL